MHGSVRQELESVLTAKPSAGVEEAASHLLECGRCARELEAMRQQAAALRKLRGPEMEPGAGFYARVLRRIEQSARRSIWWVFVYSPMGRRLAYASLALSVALGSYVLAEESRDGHLSSPARATETVTSNHTDALVMGSADEQRAAVLANFVSHPAYQPATSFSAQ